MEIPRGAPQRRRALFRVGWGCGSNRGLSLTSPDSLSQSTRVGQQWKQGSWANERAQAGWGVGRERRGGGWKRQKGLL